MIDGVWIPAEPRGRDVGDPALESLKLLCGLNPQDRQSRQEGTFARRVRVAPLRRHVRFARNAHRRAGLDPVRRREDSAAGRSTNLGMRTKLQEQLRELLELPRGFVLFSAIPGGGLRSTMDAVLHDCDRFTREFAALEEEANRYQEVENVPVTTYNAADGQPLARRAAEVLPHRAERGGHSRSGRRRDGRVPLRTNPRRPVDHQHGPGEGLRRGVVAGVGLGGAAGRIRQVGQRRGEPAA